MKCCCSQPIRTLGLRQARFLEDAMFLSVSSASKPFLRVSVQALCTRTLRLLFSMKDSTDLSEKGIVIQGKDSTFLMCGLSDDLAKS